MGRPGGRSELRGKSVCLGKEKRVIRNETGGAAWGRSHGTLYELARGNVFILSTMKSYLEGFDFIYDFIYE